MVFENDKPESFQKNRRQFFKWFLIWVGCNVVPTIYLMIYFVRAGCIGKVSRNHCGDVATYYVGSLFIVANLCFFAVAVATLRGRRKKRST